MEIKRLKILVIGSVSSTKIVIQELSKFNFELNGILGFEPKDNSKISGWVNLRELAENLNIPYKGYLKINSKDTLTWAAKFKPDIIFAVGFSQLLSEEWLNLPRLGCIGFHPTKLPRGRGRAPIAWLILDGENGASTFFLMGKGMDDGPIFIQEDFKVLKTDNAKSIEEKILKSITTGLSKWLPQLEEGYWNPVPQSEAQATYYGKRSEEDGLIDWNYSNLKIDALIRASSPPHPGAFTFLKNRKIKINYCEIERKFPIKGVVGRILIIDEVKGYLVQCGIGLLWIKIDIESKNSSIKVGEKLGYSVEEEIFKIKKILKLDL